MERGHRGAIMALVPSHVELARNKELEHVLNPLLLMEVLHAQEITRKPKIVTLALALVSNVNYDVLGFSNFVYYEENCF